VSARSTTAETVVIAHPSFGVDPASIRSRRGEYTGMSVAAASVERVAKTRAVFVCSACGQQLAQWAGRCPGCGAWGSIAERAPAVGSVLGGQGVVVGPLGPAEPGEAESLRRVQTGFEGVDRVLGGGIVPASVSLLAGEPGIGKSTLLLQLLAALEAGGRRCLLACGEESRHQVAMRARRLGLAAESIAFVPGRELGEVVGAADDVRPFLLAVDSIQTLRDAAGGQVVGGPSQVRACADALIGFAKSRGIAVVMTGHVTKDGDVAGPRTLEHAVDVILTFDGEPRSGLRMLSGGKNRFGAEGEIAWFEMREDGLAAIDPAGLLLTGDGHPGAAVALPRAGRRAIAVEVQALVVPGEGPPRRQATGLDPRRFQLVAAVLDRAAGLPLARSELFGAAAGGVKVDDPACDLAVAAALASAATGVAPPPETAFVGEVTLTGLVRPAAAMTQRVSAAKIAGVRTIVAPGGSDPADGVTIRPVRTVAQAIGLAVQQAPRSGRGRTA
jgi:DNA repair protein RadA/Sms